MSQPTAVEPPDPGEPMPDESASTSGVLETGGALTVVVDGRSDIFSAGMADPDPSRGGVLPAAIELPPGGGFIEISEVRGRVGCGPGITESADGGSCAGGHTDLQGAGNFSGIKDDAHSQFLTGVFVGSAADAPPATLDFSPSGLGVGFSELSPEPAQTFFVGDGLTGTGTGERQRFAIPDGATHLYLGYADGWSFKGKPGHYGDNTGGLAVSLTRVSP